MRIALVYMAAISAAEAITILVNPVLGIVLHIAVMLAAVMHAGLAHGLPNPNRQLVLSLALVPLVRIISLSMPLTDIPSVWWQPIIYTPLGASAFVMMRIPGYRLSDIGIRFAFKPVQLAVMLSGFVFGVLEYLILRPESTAASFTMGEILPRAIIFFLFVGFVEELMFRGVLQRTAVDAFGFRGIVYVSFLFAILHMGFYSWLDVVFVFGVALFFGWVVNKTGSLLGVTLSHGITNTMLYLVMPFLF